ncbi:MAG: tetratricopeptide repeat protein [Ignavibacteriaceae bacterium]|jgi:Flp pilus assembly protein TadD|nr:tetratricopeptide repeat protein [Ignavibacteriaceae bacterium]
MKSFYSQQLFLLVFLISPFILSQSQYPEKFKSEALQLMDYGRYGEAIDQLNKYVSALPTSAEGFNLRGVCYEKRGNYEYAVYDFRTAQKLKPDDKEINSNLNRAISAWYKILYNKIEGHKREIAINPNSAKNYLEIGKCFKHLGNWSEAEVWYDLYLEKETAYADEIIRYSEILAKNNQLVKGEKVLKIYTEKYPDDHRLLSRYGYFLLWLGKNKIAVDVFTKSLEIRPFFKEALDGFDMAKGKGYIYSINDTTVRYNYGIAPDPKEYIIDKYYRLLKSNSKDDETRYKLIEELIKANRFEEAKDQLRYLTANTNYLQKYVELSQRILLLSNSYYSDKVNYYEDILSKNPDNKTALLELAKYFSYKQEYDNSIKLYNRYLNINPADKEVKFNLAQTLMWQNNLCEALDVAESLVQQESNNIKYLLFAAKLNYWLDSDPVKIKYFYETALKVEPDNYEAMIGLANVYLTTSDFNNMDKIINDISGIDSSSTEYKKILQDYHTAQKNIKEKELNSKLEKARSLAAAKDYNLAIKLFNDYLSSADSNSNVKMELADIYTLNNQKDKAVTIYKDFLTNKPDYEINKKLAKLYLWSGDSSLALKEFIDLHSRKPEDIETKMLLGDAYLQNHQIESARIIYEDLLKESPNSHIIKTRLGWIDSPGKFSLTQFPTYIQLIPRASYFNDNTNFSYSNFGLGFDLGVTGFLSLGFSGAAGKLSSKELNVRFNQFKGTAYFKVSRFISGAASIGQNRFIDDKNSNLYELTLSANKKDVFNFTAFANYSDAVFVLYSPFLVNNRISVNHIGLMGSYKFKNKLLVSGKFQYFNLSDKNNGNQLQLRLGKEFESDLSAGYEYFYFDFKNSVSLYWSPKNFESHSLWADWNLYKDEEVSFTVGGKGGLIPENNYLLSEFYTEFDYLIIKSLMFRARFITGSSFRSGTGYRSNSISGSIIWSL